MPPPMHSVARPFLASRFCISYSSVTSTRAPDAPIGWPSAIAPPLTLTLSGVPAEILVDRAGLRGEGLVGLDQVEVVDRPAGLLQRHARGRDRPGAHDRRIDPGGAPRRRCGRAASGRAAAPPRRVISTTAARAVIDAGGVAGGHRAVLVEGRAQLRQHLDRGAVLRMLVGVDDDVALAGLDRRPARSRP